MFGIENYIQAVNNVVRIISQRYLVILILPCMQTFPDRKGGKNGFESNLENLKNDSFQKKIMKNLEKSGKTSKSDNMPGKVRHFFFSVRLN